MGKLAKDTRKLLSTAGWTFLRHAKGDHEIWTNTATGAKVTVDANMTSRHTANEILKKAGLPKAF
ncbi:MAG: type II toxin-antitoxin system HicA family toxin [Mesorhizobium sp.]|nr:type II toxin-antitoxin system HicA family toxin [Mesorhizobium sp.]MCO5162159.1 type II toxin-antitoxin system HicA family toxin [Mesorhizobium sp.]